MGIDLSKLCRLDTMVTVVDANRFINDLQSQDLLNDRGQGVSEDDERTFLHPYRKMFEQQVQVQKYLWTQ